MHTAEKYHKRIIVFSDMSTYFSSKIYGKDYSEKNIDTSRYKIYDNSRAGEYFNNEEAWNVKSGILNLDKDKLTADDKQLLLEQYKIMVDTSEKLMERRQTAVNLYTTICSALIAFIAAAFGFASLLITGIIMISVGLIMIVLCVNWYRILGAYSLNNSGKFEVINEIEKYLPSDCFECEYRYNTRNGIRSYSSREKVLPLIFLVFGILLFIVSVFLIVYGSGAIK